MTIISKIEDVLGAAPTGERIAIVEELLRRFRQRGPAAETGGSDTVEALHVWDLLSVHAYREIQFALNDVEGAGDLPWEQRSFHLLDPIIGDERRFRRYWKRSTMLELALAFRQLPQSSACAAAWSRSLLAHEAHREASARAAMRVEHRRARHATQIAVWRLHLIDGLDIDSICDRVGASREAVSRQIAEAAKIQARRAVVPCPMLAEQRPQPDDAAPPPWPGARAYPRPAASRSPERRHRRRTSASQETDR